MTLVFFAISCVVVYFLLQTLKPSEPFESVIVLKDEDKTDG